MSVSFCQLFLSAVVFPEGGVAPVGFSVLKPLRPPGLGLVLLGVTLGLAVSALVLCVCPCVLGLRGPVWAECVWFRVSGLVTVLCSQASASDEGVTTGYTGRTPECEIKTLQCTWSSPTLRTAALLLY